MVKPTFGCPHCGAHRVNKSSQVATVSAGKKQRYICRECGKTFYYENNQEEPNVQEE